MSGLAKIKGLVIGGAQSGAGKTTFSLALLAALRKRGLRVRAFKVGPDFIDPGHHTLVTGTTSHNLDGWMLSKEENTAIYKRCAQDAQVTVVEGVMGLYDGFDPLGEAGSTAQMAKWLGLPVVLLTNAKAQSRSLAALAKGFFEFDPKLSWAGLVANQVGSPNHARILGKAMQAVPEFTFLGGLTRQADLAMPERHLGLVTALETGFSEELRERLVSWLENAVDLDLLLANLPEFDLPAAQTEAPPIDSSDKVRLGIAWDKAFCFYYQENLRRLEEAGAELVYFSPLQDKFLPAELDGLYLGGGYPELFSTELADNKSLKTEIAHLAAQGMPIYAECGGMMYLAQEISDPKGNSRPMTGVLPIKTTMLPRLRSLGYRTVRFTTDTVLGPAGTRARGHEFHYSEVTNTSESSSKVNRAGSPGEGGVVNAYEVGSRKGPRPDTHGYCKQNVLASYVHLHFGSNPMLAPGFVSLMKGERKIA